MIAAQAVLNCADDVSADLALLSHHIGAPVLGQLTRQQEDF
jgi:hypothetical protein